MGCGCVAEVNDQVTEWKVGARGSAPQMDKLPFIAAQRQTDKMTDDQKRGVQLWNMMRQRLIDTGQMEEKRGG